MRDSVALARYQQRHIEPDLPQYSFATKVWQHVLVVPAYREAPDFLTRLANLRASSGTTLVILVLNRPDSDPDIHANAALRSALDQHCFHWLKRESVPVQSLNANTDLYLLDMEALFGPTPQALGVGLARKTGCDLALQWISAGGISTQWICTSDADATLPADYFEQLEQAAPDDVAAVYEFEHLPSVDHTCDRATALYELRLRHYVLGLSFAASPYAYHTLGSCLAIRASAYAHVRGFPKRAAAEDFYVLNKLAKIGSIAYLNGDHVALQSRLSSRVPFGTGPAVEAIIAAGKLEEVTLFYHPACYVALGALLKSLPALEQQPKDVNIAALLQQQGLNASLATSTQQALTALGIEKALNHCRRQAKSSAQFLRQFHNWFDAFRTLKLIHALRDLGWPQQSLQQLQALQPDLWCTGQDASRIIELRARVNATGSADEYH